MERAAHRRRVPVLAPLLIVGAFWTGCSPSEPALSAQRLPVPSGVDDLHPLLDEVRARHGLPGVAAAVFDTSGLRAVGSAGTRKVGSGIPLQYADHLQIASITKTMTATLVAILIDEGRLRWNTTIGEVYPELTAGMPPTARTITVEHLLRHESGLPGWMSRDDVLKSWVRRLPGASNRERRYEAVRHLTSLPLDAQPGARYHYTNDSYLVLGSICEQITGEVFEDLLRDRIATPLGMATLGFREPWSDGSLDQPWGHVQRWGRFVAFDPDPAGYGGVPFGTPYGAGVSASVVDLAAYGRFHLRADLGMETMLSTDAVRRLHHAARVDAPSATQVAAAGFFNEGRVDDDGRWLNVQHWGYYGRGRTLLWFSPQADVGAVVLTNGTDEDEAKGMRPISEIVIELFRRYRSTSRAAE